MAHLANAVGGSLINRSEHDVITVDDVTHDSRQVEPGTLFVAIKGSAVDGHAFVSDAIEAGASVVCVDHPIGSPVSELVVRDTRHALAALAAEVHGHPSQSMTVIGVTGTNGKTTVTHYIESLGRSASRSTGLIGTIHTRIGPLTVPSVHTTPESSDFQRLLAQMRDVETDLVAVEVSSHALALERVASTRFAIAAFTNLSQDHLDFHGDMRSYLETKRRLFTEYELGVSVVNIDSDAGRSIAKSVTGDLLTIGEGGDVKVSGIQSRSGKSVFRMDTPWGSNEMTAPIMGAFNIDNAVMAAACVLTTGLEFEAVLGGLMELSQVPGRYEIVSDDDPITVVVDYAHTPEGIEKAIDAAREITAGNVIALVGAGGDRDRRKRPQMGAAISAADLAFVTSDNPRSEDPAEIATSVATGIDPGSEHRLELDRTEAINAAIEAADDGDVVLILGRGHEPYQEFHGQKRPFDDRDVARLALAAVRSATDPGPGSGSMNP